MTLFKRSKRIEQPSWEEFNAQQLQMAKEEAAATDIRRAAAAWERRGNKPIVEYQVIEDKRIK